MSRLVRARANWTALVPALARMLAVALVAGLGACERSPGGPTPKVGAARQVRVVATTGMIADAARVIAGDRAAVTGLMGPGVDPHLYKPTPLDMHRLGDADLVLYNGLHLEGRMAETLERLAAKKPSIAVTDRIPEAKLRTPEDYAGAHDPHVWLDASLWALVAERIRDALIAVDPEGRAGYESRAAAYAKDLAALDAFCRSTLAGLGPTQRVLVTAHDAFGYFGAAYGLEVLGIQGISTDSEPDLRSINALVDLLVTRRIPAVFIESSVPPKAVEALVEGARARGHRLTVGGELYSDALGPEGSPGGTYLGMVRHNVETIHAALGGAGPTHGASTAGASGALGAKP